MKFKGYVIDLEGTIFQNGSEILGSFNFIRMLQSNKVPFRVITNTVSKSTEEMATLLKSCGLEIPSSYILNPIKALNYYLEEIQSSSYFFVGPSYIQSQLSIPPDFNGNPNYVILCDFEKISLSYNLLNQIFSYLLNGASLMSTSYSDFYLSKEGYKLDTGSFTKMFEIVGNQKATILGKPSKKTEGRKRRLKRPHVLPIMIITLLEICKFTWDWKKHKMLKLYFATTMNTLKTDF